MRTDRQGWAGVRAECVCVGRRFDVAVSQGQSFPLSLSLGVYTHPSKWRTISSAAAACIYIRFVTQTHELASITQTLSYTWAAGRPARAYAGYRHPATIRGSTADWRAHYEYCILLSLSATQRDTHVRMRALQYHTRELLPTAVRCFFRLLTHPFSSDF